MTDQEDKELEKEISELEAQLGKLEADTLSDDLDAAISESANLKTTIDEAEKEVEEAIAAEAIELEKDVAELEKLAENLDTKDN